MLTVALILTVYSSGLSPVAAATGPCAETDHTGLETQTGLCIAGLERAETRGRIKVDCIKSLNALNKTNPAPYLASQRTFPVQGTRDSPGRGHRTGPGDRTVE